MKFKLRISHICIFGRDITHFSTIRYCSRWELFNKAIYVLTPVPMIIDFSFHRFENGMKNRYFSAACFCRLHDIFTFHSEESVCINFSSWPRAGETSYKRKIIRSEKLSAKVKEQTIFFSFYFLVFVWVNEVSWVYK